MKMKLLVLLLLFLAIPILHAQSPTPSYALHLDGKDNNVRTGIGMLTESFTLEAWMKGNDTRWNELEVIFGGGEYSLTNRADHLPLVIKNGHLHNTWANLSSPHALDDQWHHVALTCDQVTTRLYLDGLLVDSATTAIAVLPGALGLYEDETTTFGGLLHEVRVWQKALTGETLRAWMGKPLEPSHPGFASLVAYYNFDDGFRGDVSPNWVGKGDQAYHLRNGRCNYKGTAPLAHTVPNDNPRFTKPVKQQELFSAVVVASEWDVQQGAHDDQVVKLRLTLTGSENPLSLTELTIDLSQLSSPTDITRLHVYHTGKSARSEVKNELFSFAPTEKRMVYSNPKGLLTLTPGINYLLVTVDVAATAKVGNRIKLSIPSFKLNETLHTPVASQSSIHKTITDSPANNPNLLTVLQWNIWHGGQHLGNDGVGRMIELIKATRADIITMQETYGSQERIRDALGYTLQSPSMKDNLALFSRYPLTKVETKRPFFSNPALVTLPNKRTLLVNSCWLRYAYRPEYTCNYPSRGHNTHVWIQEDSTQALADARPMIMNDTKPHETEDMAVIIGGDFNSCSHLDWTDRAAHLHYGYGKVPFPASCYMAQEGYTDTFRAAHPDEVNRPEGTFAAIYGHLQTNRIDFLYSKGKGLKILTSKIVKTAPEIDDVWASDHSAVLTTFELAPPSRP